MIGPLGPADRWALVVEFQAERDPEMLDRLLEYAARLRRELRHGRGRRGRYRVAAALVQMAGASGPDSLDMTWAGESPIGLRFRVASRTLRDEDAASTLAEIAAGRASRWILPWVPLMKGAAKPTITEEWKQLAIAEPNPRWRADYAGLALVFAGLTRHLDRWERALEGWNMRESPVVTRWKAEGKAEGEAEGEAKARRADLLGVLASRFPGRPPAGLVADVEGQKGLEELSRWFEIALVAPTLADFLAASEIVRPG